MSGVDTNVLLRFLLEDDPEQTDRVHRFLARCRRTGEPVYVSLIVLYETVWVLRSAFGKSRPELAGILEQLLGSDIFELEQAAAVRTALDLFQAVKADFADCLIAQINRANGCGTTVTFDGPLRSVSGFTTLK